MSGDNSRLVTVAQLIAQNNRLSHDTEDFIDAARAVLGFTGTPDDAEELPRACDWDGYQRLRDEAREQYRARADRLEAWWDYNHHSEEL